MIKEYKIKEKVWLYPGKAGWNFVTIPAEVSNDINYFFDHQKKGWGSLPVKVTLGKTQWKTSIFPDKKSNTFLLPLKAEVRKKEDFKVGDLISFTIEIEG